MENKTTVVVDDVTNDSATYTPAPVKPKNGSKFVKVTPSDQYRPKAKEPSKRDLWREEVAARKAK